MHRFALDYLRTWKSAPRRKPLVIRGARQVGKSHLVREFARLEFANIVEINFERDPGAASLFDSNDPRVIVPLVEVRFDAPVRPGETLLFLDEIQAAAGVLAALRYFHEELPTLHVFLRERERSFAVRFNAERPSLLDGTTALADGRNRKFRLLSLPLYLVGQFLRLCEDAEVVTER
jgi:predicted AAA+ superfamily ATPase